MKLLDLLKEYQLNIMLVLSSICGLLAFFVAITKAMPAKRKWILLSLELGAMFLLIFDRFAYYFRGDTSDIGFWMVRISNFFVFFLTLTVIYAFDLYLIDLFHNEGGMKETPRRLKISLYCCTAAIILLIISQFTGFYYTFDENNYYQRSDGFMICYLFPLIVLLLDISFIVENLKRIRKLLRTSILLFSLVPLIAAVVQLFAYGFSLISISIVGMAVLLYVFSLLDMNERIERANKLELEMAREEQRNIQLMFTQTATALANAIDAKDKYTHGHSRRVAEYSVKIARYLGRSEKECEELYFAALLHDVGKIGISDSIINKEGKLTDEEFAAIKAHPVIGMQILSSISQSPYLSIGAHYHHERYDGKGYPEGLKGEDIPDIARIIAVADAYDAMTSKRSYRDPIPQQLVREEFVKGKGTQFDPNYAKIMLHLIDIDTEYAMKEREEVMELDGRTSLVCGSYRSELSDGIRITNNITRIHLSSYMHDSKKAVNIPSLVLFDSLDARIHKDERKRRDLLYLEYASIRADGLVEVTAARNVKTTVTGSASAEAKAMLREKVSYDIEAVRYRDHVLIRMANKYRSHEIIIALPDCTRYSYISITGEQCTIDDVEVAKTGEEIGEGYIPRIAEEVTYIDVPAGDIPNVQVDDWRSASSVGIEVTDGMRIQFHSKSLPTARLVWHCPFAVLYSSEDGQVGGKDYRELTVVRLDGEGWEEDEATENYIRVNKLDSFTDWNDWKAKNKAGQDCEICYHVEGGRITITSDYCGLSIRSVTTISDGVPKLYTALTGDQCALTNIHIIRAS